MAPVQVHVGRVEFLDLVPLGTCRPDKGVGHRIGVAALAAAPLDNDNLAHHISLPD